MEHNIIIIILKARWNSVIKYLYLQYTDRVCTIIFYDFIIVFLRIIQVQSTYYILHIVADGLTCANIIIFKIIPLPHINTAAKS